MPSGIKFQFGGYQIVIKVAKGKEKVLMQAYSYWRILTSMPSALSCEGMVLTSVRP